MSNPMKLLSHGHGPVKVVVLGGWLGVARHWLPMLQAMEADRFECVVFDYRGYGSRRDQPGEYHFEEAAADVIAMADAREWSRFSIVGHSMGGMAMQRVALQAPGRVERLLGIAPVSAAGSNMDPARRAFFESAVDDIAARERILHLSTGQRLTPAWCRATAAESQENHPDAVRAYLKEWTSGGFAASVVGLGLPVKLLLGEFDPSIHVELVRSTWAVHHPQAEIEVVPQTGHYPMQELPLAVAARAEAWLHS